MNKTPDQEESFATTPGYGSAPLHSLPAHANRATFTPKTLRSSLAKHQLSRPASREEMHDLAVTVWRQRGLALIDPLVIPDDFARQALINEANRLYGRRAGAAVVHTEEVQ